jgi:hypothetical protein
VPNCFPQIVGPAGAAIGYRRGTPRAVTNVVAVSGNRRMSGRIVRPFPQVGRMSPPFRAHHQDRGGLCLTLQLNFYEKAHFV